VAAVVRTRRHFIDQQFIVPGEKKFHCEDAAIVEGLGQRLCHRDGALRNGRRNADIEDAVAVPVLDNRKTAQLGYDGKGQAPVDSLADAEQGFRQLGETPCVLEQRVDLQLELSVILARLPFGDPYKNLQVVGYPHI